MSTYGGLGALLIASGLCFAAPAWSADASAAHPAVTAPSPTTAPAMGSGMSGMGQSNAAPSPFMMNCREHMGGMQKSLGAMMGNIDDMMKNAKTADMREHLQAMRDQMSAMMTRMQQMQGMMGSGMMHGGMMQGGQEPSNTPATPPAQADHNAHHSN